MSKYRPLGSAPVAEGQPVAGQSFAAPVAARSLWQTAPGGFPVMDAGTTPWAFLMGFYALTLTVPIAQILVAYFHIHIPIVVIADAFLTIGLILSGNMGAFLKTPFAKPWLALMVLFAFAAVFGLYRGMSVPFIAEYIVRFHVFPFYCCALAFNARSLRHTFGWVAWGSFLLIFLSLKFGQDATGRLALPDTDLSNPNDLGLALLFGMCGLLLVESRVLRIIAPFVSAVFIYEILKTGSRACMVTIVALVIIVFLVGPARTKIILAVLAPIAILVFAAMVPRSTLQRLTLIVTDPNTAAVDESLRTAVDSQVARTELQRRAVQLTLEHPLLGVGAGMFEDAVEGMIRQHTGRKSGWQGAHNTYLQVAAENGILAALIYVWCLFLCVKVNYGAYKFSRSGPESSVLAKQSFGLMMMTLAFAVCTFFSNNAYDLKVCVLIGFSAANYLAWKRELSLSLQPQCVSWQAVPTHGVAAQFRNV